MADENSIQITLKTEDCLSGELPSPHALLVLSSDDEESFPQNAKQIPPQQYNHETSQEQQQYASYISYLPHDQQQQQQQQQQKRKISSPSENLLDHHHRQLTTTTKRPKVPNKEAETEWSDEDTRALIVFWRKEELLYNAKHPKYFSKEEREGAMKRIIDSLIEAGAAMAEARVLNKMISLRAYYSGQMKKEKRAKSNNIVRANGEPYRPTWKYMKDLKFLSDVIVPRRSSTKHASSHFQPATTEHCEGNLAFLLAQKGSATNISIGQVNSPPVSAALKQPAQPHSPQGGAANKTPRTISADDAFCDMIKDILKEIGEGEIKDMLKLKIHQDVLQAKYKGRNPHSN